jgi:hypothetical protein
MLTSYTTTVLCHTHLDPLLSLFTENLAQCLPHTRLEIGQELGDTAIQTNIDGLLWSCHVSPGIGMLDNSRDGACCKSSCTDGDHSACPFHELDVAVLDHFSWHRHVLRQNLQDIFIALS